MKKQSFHLISAMLATFTLLVGSGCVTIRQGEVGVKRTFGKYSDAPYTEGLRVFNPFTTQVIKISVQTENLEVGLNIPSKEGLNIQSEVSILYKVIPTEAPNILRKIGRSYEANIILPVFRSAVADVTSRFYAKDMHTGERAVIERAIQEQMTTLLEGRGIIIEAVLLKSIQMPPSLARAIEEKLEAEQQAQRMEFVLLQAQQEAERRRIEAAGVRDAQIIIGEGLSPEVLQFKSIEAFLQLAQSPNAKVIISDGDLPFLMEQESGTNTSTRNTRLKN
jgi:prohibitin 1